MAQTASQPNYARHTPKLNRFQREPYVVDYGKIMLGLRRERQLIAGIFVSE